MKATAKVKTTLLGLAIIGSMASCKKDDGGDSSPSKTDIITSGEWQFTAVTMNPGYVNPLTGDTITDFFAYMDACDKDNTIDFKRNGTVIEDEGATKCDDNDPQSTTDNWKFLNSATQLQIYSDTDTTLLNISSLSSSEIITTSQDEDALGDGVSREMTFTLSKVQ